MKEIRLVNLSKSFTIINLVDHFIKLISKVARFFRKPPLNLLPMSGYTMPLMEFTRGGDEC